MYTGNRTHDQAPQVIVSVQARSDELTGLCSPQFSIYVNGVHYTEVSSTTSLAQKLRQGRQMLRIGFDFNWGSDGTAFDVNTAVFMNATQDYFNALEDCST